MESTLTLNGAADGENQVKPLNGEKEWSEEQKNIFKWFGESQENLVVEALAGTGKTTTIKESFRFAPEKKMLYCVFNKKNQIEAAEKIKDARVEVKTLHSVGFSYIKKVWFKARPDNDVENDRINQFIYREKAAIKSAVRKLVGFAKNTLVNPSLEDLEDLADERGIEVDDFNWPVKKLAEVTLQVLEASKRPDPQNRISFDDMVWLPVANNWVKASYDLVVVDECQDMNVPQLAMARLSSKGRVCVVGDRHQAIYYFRGAASNGMDLMKQELNATELTLSTTYRCGKEIVKVAQNSVPNYRAHESNPEGIVDSIASDAVIATAKPGDAILSRLNAPLMPLCLRFLKNGISARIEGRDIGKALLTIVWGLKATNISDFIDKLQSWGDKRINRVLKTKNGDKKASDITDQVETLLALAEGAASMQDIENKLNILFVDGGSNNSVLLSSTHKAKGLEWERVFILKDTYNRIRPDASSEAQREEGNIYYVAVTRAKKHLTLVGN